MPGRRRSRGEGLGGGAARGPLGAVLAGGAARRMGGAKMTAPLDGEPLVAHAVRALAGAVEEVVVVAKDDTPLPPLDVPVWTEPDAPRHPLAGIAFALSRSGGRPVLVLAGDMPHAPHDLLLRLASDAGSAPAVVPRHSGGPEPLIALYRPAALDALREAASSGASARATVEGLAPEWVEWDDADALRSINRPEDLG